MITKLLTNPGTFPRFSALVQYILEDDGPERAEQIRTSNTSSSDPQDAFREMMATLDSNQTTRTDKAYHLIVAFPVGENPAPEVMNDIEDKLVAALGMSDHQRIRAVHKDTSHTHMHIAIVKVHPASGRNITPFQSWPKLAKAARALEREHGLEVLDTNANQVRSIVKSELGSPAASWESLQAALEDSGVQMMASGNGLVIESPDGGVSLTASSVDPDLSRSNLEALLGPLPDDFPEKPAPATMPPSEDDNEAIRRHLEAALNEDGATWQTVQLAMGQIGLRLTPRGRGMVVESPDGTIRRKLSELDRELSREKLEKRLGQYENVETGLPAPKANVTAERNPEIIREYLEAALKKDGATWQTVQLAMGQIGLRLTPRGRGMVVESLDGTFRMKCSAIDRGLSRGSLEKLLGGFPKEMMPKGPDYNPRRLDHERDVPNGKSLYAQYRKEEEARGAERRKRFDKYRESSRARRAAVKQVFRESRGKLWANAMLSKAQKFDINRRIKLEQKTVTKELLKTLAGERKTIRNELGPRTWVSWLQAKASEGHGPALDALHRRRDRKKEMTEIQSEGWRQLPAGAGQRLLPAMVDEAISFRVSTIGDIQVSLEKDNVDIVIREGRMHLVKQAPDVMSMAKRLESMSEARPTLEMS